MHRRRFIALAPLLFALPGLTLAGTEPELREDEVQVANEKEMYVGRFGFVVAIPPAIAWEVLTDFDHMASFIPNLEASRIVSREDGVFRIAQRGTMDYGPFTFHFESERRVEARQREGVLLSRALSGSAKHMQSEMRLTAEDGGTRIDYRIEMIPGQWVPSGIAGGLLRRQLAEQFSAMAREMMRRQQRRRGS